MVIVMKFEGENDAIGISMKEIGEWHGCGKMSSITSMISLGKIR